MLPPSYASWYDRYRGSNFPQHYRNSLSNQRMFSLSKREHGIKHEVRMTPALFCTQPWNICKSRLLHRNTLGQVPREIDIEALSNRKPVGHQLQGNDVKQTLERIHGLGHLNFIGLLTGEFRVILVADDNGTTFTGNDLLVGVEGFHKEWIACQDHDDWKILIDQGKDTVLELTRHNGFTVEIGDFLDLKGTYN